MDLQWSHISLFKIMQPAAGSFALTALSVNPNLIKSLAASSMSCLAQQKQTQKSKASHWLPLSHRHREPVLTNSLKWGWGEGRADGGAVPSPGWWCGHKKSHPLLDMDAHTHSQTQVYVHAQILCIISVHMHKTSTSCKHVCVVVFCNIYTTD